MPRSGASMLYGSASASQLLWTETSATNSGGVIQVAYTPDEVTKFSELRSIIANTMSRIIQRDPDTNSVLASIAIGRSKLAEMASKN